jgi:hypothetical protein
MEPTSSFASVVRMVQESMGLPPRFQRSHNPAKANGWSSWSRM